MNASTLFQNAISFGEDLQIVVRTGAFGAELTSDITFTRIRIGLTTQGDCVDISKLSKDDLELRGIEDQGEALLLSSKNGHRVLEPTIEVKYENRD